MRAFEADEGFRICGVYIMLRFREFLPPRIHRLKGENDIATHFLHFL